MNRTLNRCLSFLLLLTCLCAAASQLRPLSARIAAASLYPTDALIQAQTTNPALSYLARTPIGQSIAVDAQGNSYVVAAVQRNNNSDLAVMKLNPQGTQFVYNTIIGGSDDDQAQEIALDAAGNLYITGSTYSPDLPNASAAGGGVFFKSADGGMRWERSGAELRKRERLFNALLVDPNNPAIIYAGSTGGNSGAAIFKSVDGGRSWASLNESLGQVIAPRLLAVQGGATTSIYVGTSAGLLKSSDGGATWSEAGLKNTGGVNFLVIDPSNPSQLYAVAGNDIYPGGRIYRSTDGAATWQPANNGVPSDLGIVWHLAIDQKNPTTLYTIVSGNSSGQVICRTTDGARNWGTLPSRFAAATLRTLTVDPFNSAALYVSTDNGIFKSTDGGQSWQAAGLDKLFVSMVLADPNVPGTLYAAAPRKIASHFNVAPGVYKSTDGGNTWQQFDHRLRRLPVTTISFDPLNSATLYALTESYAEAFALKVDAANAEVRYASYLGPGAGRALALDVSGNVYLAGALLAGSANAQIGSGEAISFVTRLNERGESSAYNFTWAGDVVDLALDPAGKLYVAGMVTKGNTVPIKDGVRTEFSRDVATFLTKLDPNKTAAEALLYSTYLEFSILDRVQAVAVDAQGRAYVLGALAGNSMFEAFTNQIFAPPVTLEATGFLVQLDTSKSGAASLGWSARLPVGTYKGLALDAGSDVYVTGGAGAGYPTTPGAVQVSFSINAPTQHPCTCPLMFGFCPVRCFPLQLPSSDAVLTKIRADGSAIVYSTYLGSSNPGLFEAANDIALDAAGNVYLAGLGTPPDTTGALQAGDTGFVAKLTPAARSTTVASVSAASFATGPVAPESLAVAFLDAFGQGVDLLRMQIRDSASAEADMAVFYRGPGQINFQLPANLAPGAATVRVLSNGGVIATGIVEIAPVAPGVFAANANGRGVAAAVAQRVTADNTQTYEPVARYEQPQNQFVPVPIDLGAETDQIFLVLFGTGWRGRSAESAVRVTIGGVDVPVTYASLQPTLQGVDQINARLPRSLMGRGEVDVVVTVDGKTANTVKVNVR